MRKFIYVLIIFLGCKEYKVSKEKSNMKTFKCSFVGETSDINTFLVKNDNYNADGIKLLFLGDFYTFSNERELSIMYSKKGNILETYKPEFVSGQFETDRKYKIQSIDSTKNSIKLTLQSGDRTFTKLEGKSLIIKCSEID